MSRAFLSGMALVLALSTCAGSPAFAFVSPSSPECFSKTGDTDAAVEAALLMKFPQDDHYLFTGQNMMDITGGAMEARKMDVLPPVEMTELWVSTGPGGNGSTVFVYFQDDCFLGSFNLTPEEWVAAFQLAFPNGYEPYYVGIPTSKYTEYPI